MVSKTLFLTVGMSPHVVLEQLQSVREACDTTSIHMVHYDFGGSTNSREMHDGDEWIRQEHITEQVAKTLLQLFQFDSRNWNTIKFQNCRGKWVHKLVQAAATASVRRLLIDPTGTTTHSIMASLAMGLASTTCRLSTLMLSSVQWNASLLELMSVALCRNTSLNELSIEHCHFPVNNSCHLLLAKALSQLSHRCQLQHLSLSQCQLEDDICYDLIQALVPLDEKDNGFAIATGGSALIEVSLDGNKCCHRGVQALAELIVKTPSLLALDLSSQRVEDIDLSALSEGLANSNLRCLELNDNSLSLSSIQALASALQRNSSLQILQLAWTMMDQARVLALANALRWNMTLKKLVLFDAGLNNFSLSRLANRLGQMQGLEHLDVGGTQQEVDAVGLWSLWAGLQRNTAIQHVVVPSSCSQQCKNHYDERLHAEAVEQVQFLCDLNRGGRRLLQHCHKSPSGLWPLVLSTIPTLDLALNQGGNECEDFCGTLHKASEMEKSNSRQLEIRRTSVLFYLLQNGALLQR